MKLSNTYFFLLFISFLAIYACSDDEDDLGFDFTIDGTEIAMSEIAGNWNASKAVFDSRATGPAMQVDVVDEGGTVTMNIQVSGQFSITVTEVGKPADTSTGLLRFDEELLVIFFDDDPGEWEYFSINLAEPNLFINGGNGSADFDFDGDGTDEPADVDFEFVRI
jgi:hypothetical protein